MNYINQVEEAVRYLEQKLLISPDIIIQLGTGLGEFAEAVTQSQTIPYSKIPHFRKSTMEFHEGNLITGVIAGKNVAVLQGRMHYYEGYSTLETTLPIRVMSLLGGKHLIISNAAGGLNHSLTPGTLMIIKDHINLIGENPLRGANVDKWGDRFPDMSEVYSSRLINIAREAAKRNGIDVSDGVYVAVPGPSLETPAETRLLIKSGADAVGMSTVPEVIVAKQAGLEILGISVLANSNDPDNFRPILLQEVIDKVKKTEPIFNQLIVEVIKEM